MYRHLVNPKRSVRAQNSPQSSNPVANNTKTASEALKGEIKNTIMNDSNTCTLMSKKGDTWKDLKTFRIVQNTSEKNYWRCHLLRVSQILYLHIKWECINNFPPLWDVLEEWKSGNKLSWAQYRSVVLNSWIKKYCLDQQQWGETLKSQLNNLWVE